MTTTQTTTPATTAAALGALTQIDQAIRTLRHSLQLEHALETPTTRDLVTRAVQRVTQTALPHLYTLTTTRPSQTVLKRATPATRAIVTCLLTYPGSTKARIMRMTGYTQSTVENTFHFLRTQRLLVGAPPAL